MFELNFQKLLTTLKEKKLSLGEYTLQTEMEREQKSREEIVARMEKVLETMQESAAHAQNEPVLSVSGLTGGDAFRYGEYVRKGKSTLGKMVAEAAVMALSCSEVNASMSRIVACPTAGSCGIVPAALLAAAGERHKQKDELLMALFTASGVGILIGDTATLSGAEGGCQAECGSAAAMAAAGVVELLGGMPCQAFHAAAMALKSVLGMVCDPVAGLVEIPCIKRNASGAVNALLCADLALAGVESHIPFDEVVGAMYSVGKTLPPSLRETAQGGLAVTPTAKKLQKQVLNHEEKETE